MPKLKVLGILLVIVLAVAIGALVYFGSKPSQPATPAKAVVELPTGERIEVPENVAGKVVFYTSIPDVIVNSWKGNWSKYFGSTISLEVWRSGTGKVVAKLLAEKKAGSVEADVVYIASPFEFETLINESIIEKFPDIPELKYIPQEYRDPRGYYVWGRVLVMVIVYNPNIVTDPPKSWQDLVKPEWKGKVVIANPLYSGSTQVAVAALASKFGWSYFEKLKENDVLVVQDVPDVARVVATGERPVGVTLTMYLGAYPTLKFVAPEEGAIAIPSPVGLVKNAKHPEDAKVFLRFLLSKLGAQALTDAYTYSTRIDAPAPKGLPPLSQLKILKVSMDELRPIVSQIRDKWTQIFGG
ncbi:ABC transporter substrate-binding protein [Thermofilum pendens]|uniref:Extracellular solute-binding protein, family 1 n=1 Tax=Thermofilum pendens (strain DSM 2475 / Hrk 5) TaxID=368408 RepID=A1S0H0_THEPD|nr:ABC transporter substrate-binding protein [Thermofilum pendens]ABL78950.1 extracellular solute-binding protein, family 1 [Thermofilum pendens Hrk 5]